VRAAHQFEDCEAAGAHPAAAVARPCRRSDRIGRYVRLWLVSSELTTAAPGATKRVWLSGSRAARARAGSERPAFWPVQPVPGLQQQPARPGLEPGARRAEHELRANAWIEP